MTALRQYQRLETSGLWRETPDDQRKDVIVSFGEASLVISDIRTERALSHWSLPAVERLNPDETPALYAPGVDAGETLEIDDETMIAALEKVRGVVAQRQRRPGRLRLWSFAATAAALLGLAVFWLPAALVSHTASVVPYAKRVEIGQRILQDMARDGMLSCRAPLGLRAAARLRDRLLGPDGGEIVVIDEGLAATAHLPGRHVLVGRGLVEGHDAPEILAGHILAERLRADAEDPLLLLLRTAGLRATFQLLTTGNLPAAALDGYGAAVVAHPAAPVPEADFLARMQAAGVPTTPYAYSLDPSGRTTLGLIEGDPFRTVPPRPVLADGDWVSLQQICNG
ncbi:hypothetical protein ACFQXB_03485 [Plastorhodobacter daqingensis]|uniref:Uncharacterized protein n=1 Tax=Plastorhodobacter daqingensis TaxID=1387281 RepID=A0ABW2UI99_9RHOB